MVNSEQLWLVKSSGRILGPFTTAKVKELVRSREVALLDEVSAASRRWQTLQYHESFKDFANRMRISSVSDKTEATWTATATNTSTALTQSATDARSEVTEEISTGAEFSSSIREIVVHDVPEETRIVNKGSSGRYQTQETKDTAIQRQVEKTTRGLWLVTSIVLVSVVAFVVQKRLVHLPLDRGTTPFGHKESVLNKVQVGEYAEALRDLRQMFPDPRQANELAIYYGALLIQLEGQTLQGRGLLTSIVSGHKQDLKQAYAGLGVADIIDGQFDSARENLNQALALDAIFTPALVDQASLQLRNAAYDQAKTTATNALRTNPNSAEAMLVLAESQLYLFRKTGKIGDLNQVNKMIKHFCSNHWDYSNELGFYGIYFDFLNQDKMLSDKIRDYLDRDPQMTSDHRHNLFIDRGIGQWRVLARYCEAIAEKMGDEPGLQAFLASCSSHENNWEQARARIEKAVGLAPKDSLIQAWYSFILKESGDGDQATAALSRATELNRNGEVVLPILLQARFCAGAKVIDCARAGWQQIYERDLDNLPAVSGLAWVNADKGFHSEALKFLKKGLGISPEYIPLLKLRQRAEREGWYALSK